MTTLTAIAGGGCTPIRDEPSVDDTAATAVFNARYTGVGLESASAQAARAAIADSVQRRTARAAAIKALAAVQVRQDEFSRDFAVQPKGTSPYWNTSNGLRPGFFVDNLGEITGAFLTVTYRGEDWVFFDNVILLADGATHMLNVDRDAAQPRKTNVNGANSLSEAASFPALDGMPAARMIEAMITARSPVKVRLIGSSNRSQRTLGESELAGARAVMAALAALKELPSVEVMDLLERSAGRTK